MFVFVNLFLVLNVTPFDFVRCQSAFCYKSHEILTISSSFNQIVEVAVVNFENMKNFIVIIGIALATVHSTYCCKCVAPGENDQVCASDGKTRDSSCLLFCEGLYRNETEPCLTEVHSGACSSTECICTDTCAYVCGSNGQSYGNDCTLECAKQFDPNLEKVKNGRCGECICTFDYTPVCGSDSVTYGNECALNCQKEKDIQLTKVSDGECPASSN